MFVVAAFGFNSTHIIGVNCCLDGLHIDLDMAAKIAGRHQDIHTQTLLYSGTLAHAIVKLNSRPSLNKTYRHQSPETYMC